jgi:hypothetical protein
MDIELRHTRRPISGAADLTSPSGKSLTNQVTCFSSISCRAWAKAANRGLYSARHSDFRPAKKTITSTIVHLIGSLSYLLDLKDSSNSSTSPPQLVKPQD